MKPLKLIYPVILTIMMLYSCTDDLLLKDDLSPYLESSFTDKPSVLKLSFIEENVRRTEFPNGNAIDLGLTFLEEPKSERKRTYIEVYDDFTFSKEIVYLGSVYNYPADNHELPADMPQLKRLLYQNGITKGFDADGNLILEEEGGEQYWIEPSIFNSNEEAREYLFNFYRNPAKNADIITNHLKENNGIIELSDEVFEISKNLTENDLGKNEKGAVDEDIVVHEKKYLLKKYGIVYRTEGYTSSGRLKDMEHNFYGFNSDSILYLKSSHYRNEELLAGYDIPVLEISDIFYSDFKFETTL